MNIQIINHEFQKVVNTRGIFQKLGVSKNVVAQYRWKLKLGIHISLDKKLWVLQKAGCRLDVYEYTDADLVRVIDYTIRVSQHTRAMGAAYVLEKFKQNEKSKNSLSFQFNN
jgi:hypothetical protein